jgi:hypothetical protein
MNSCHINAVRDYIDILLRTVNSSTPYWIQPAINNCLTKAQIQYDFISNRRAAPENGSAA